MVRIKKLTMAAIVIPKIAPPLSPDSVGDPLVLLSEARIVVVCMVVVPVARFLVTDVLNIVSVDSLFT